MRHRLLSRVHEIVLMLDFRKCKKHDELETVQGPTKDTAKKHVSLRPTTWYLPGRSEILSTPSAARGTISWGSLGVIRTESVDGLETCNEGFRPLYKPFKHTSSARA